MKKVVLITGGSSGIGLAVSRLYSKNEYKVFEFSRNGKSHMGITHIEADLSDENSVKNAFEKLKEKTDSIDILINNAGYGIAGPIELTELADAKRLFDVNFFGAFYCIKEALPLLRVTNGIIVNVSSVAATLPIPFQAFYSASKSALNSLTLALANELKPLGVRITSIMPGDIQTGFSLARIVNETENEIYEDSSIVAIKKMEKDEQRGIKPTYVAEQIYRITFLKNPRLLYTIGKKYKLLVFISRFLPVTLINAIIKKIYC